jgi:hypothetical protein
VEDGLCLLFVEPRNERGICVFLHSSNTVQWQEVSVLPNGRCSCPTDGAGETPALPGCPTGGGGFVESE